MRDEERARPFETIVYSLDLGKKKCLRVVGCDLSASVTTRNGRGSESKNQESGHREDDAPNTKTQRTIHERTNAKTQQTGFVHHRHTCLLIISFRHFH